MVHEGAQRASLAGGPARSHPCARAHHSVAGAHNWFADPAFTKAQWREAAAYVRSHIGPDERVVLVSGHAAPAWNYYAADLPPLRLPDIDILDVNAVLGFDTGAALARGCRARTARGSWNGRTRWWTRWDSRPTS